jgi:hypothetical protein
MAIAPRLGTVPAIVVGMTRTNAAATTETLWTAAHTALCSARWIDAIEALDALCQATTFAADLLCSASAYSVPESLQSTIQARIDLANSRVR